MGNSGSMSRVEEDIWWTNGETSVTSERETSNVQIDLKASQRSGVTEIDDERAQRRKEMEQDLVKFKQDLARKHERGRQIIKEKRREMTDLREELARERDENIKLKRLLKEERRSPDTGGCDIKSQDTALREENEDLRNEVERLKLLLREKEVIVDKNKELRIGMAEMQRELQDVNTQIINFEKERIDYQEHVTALKDIIRVTKEMLRVRESQIEELKKKIGTIEELLASKEINILSDDLRQEYERQLRNIRDLRILYEDRQRADKRDKENLQSQVEDLKKSLEDEQKKNEELTERINELEEDNSKKYDKLVSLESNLGFSQAECKELHAEMDVINQLFSQILISFNNDQDIDLDNMIKILEENHALLTNIVVNDESNQTFALPKVLLDLVKQVNEHKKDNRDDSHVTEEGGAQPIQEETSKKLETIVEEEIQPVGTHQLNSPEEIVENLPKVWRVLIELLSHQCPPNNEITEKKGENDSHCYKSVETPSGLREVLSVSKTFIRLKSLILEKKSLEKEMTRLKQLNTHLEGRLSDQEKRLVLVSSELSKTWNFVGKMQKQHQQLHTQEKILRYELAQKRKLLTELKEELEYCRQKWLQARKQNSTTEEQWKQLRTEFASRKIPTADDTNNSVESGYSDDKSSSDEEETEFHNNNQKPEDGHLILEKENPEIDTNINQNTVNSYDSSDPLAGGEAKEDEVSNKVESNEKISDAQDVLIDESTQSNDMHSLQTENIDEIILSSELESGQNKNEENLEKESELSENCPNNENVKDSIKGISENTTQVLNQSPSTSNPTDNESVPSSSHKNPVEAATEFLARREQRMRNLEEQCKDLYFSVAKNSLRGVVMSNKLDNLHEMYGAEQPGNTEEEGAEPLDTQESKVGESSPDNDNTDRHDQE